MRAFALSRLFGFSASSDDDEKQGKSSEIVPKASSERSRKTKNATLLSELVGRAVAQLFFVRSLGICNDV